MEEAQPLRTEWSKEPEWDTHVAKWPNILLTILLI